MKTAVFKNWHTWETGFAVCLSCEKTKTFFSFKSWDDCINYLYISGEKEAARAINEQVKK